MFSPSFLLHVKTQKPCLILENTGCPTIKRNDYPTGTLIKKELYSNHTGRKRFGRRNNNNNNNNLILILRAFHEMIKHALQDFYL